MTDRMIQILRALEAEGEAMSCNAIGLALGFDHGMHGNRLSHSGKRMGPANRVNFAVSRLDALGLVRLGSRPDGLSGTAYSITQDGRDFLADIVGSDYDELVAT